MGSMLLISQDKKSAKEYVEKFAQSQMINVIDITIVEEGDESEKKKAKEVKSYGGIDLIRQLKQSAYLKPIKSKLRIILITNTDLFTTEAQNALLKLLEEPPLTTQIILHAEGKNRLLPTILSRCTIIVLAKQTPNTDTFDDQKDLLDVLTQFSAKDALEKAEKLAKNKEEAIDFLEKMILCTRKELLESIINKTNTPNTSFYLQSIRLFQQTLTVIKSTNTNLRLTLENLLLSFIEHSAPVSAQPQGLK